MLDQAPTLDGQVLDDPAWRPASPAESFTDLRTGQLPEKSTAFRIGYTSEALFVGVVCQEPDMDSLWADLPDGERFSREDSVSLYLSIGGKAFVEFSVNAIGSRYCRRTLQRWEAHSHSGEDHWSIEIMLPWEVLGERPQQDAPWRLNLIRFIPKGETRDLSTWADLAYWYGEVERYGRLHFEGLTPELAQAIGERIRSQRTEEDLLVYSRPGRGLFVESTYAEEMIAYNQGAHLAPRLSPDGHQVLFASKEGGGIGVWLSDSAGTHKERLCDGSQPAWAPGGDSFVYQHEGRLYERRLDGEARPVSPAGAPPLAFPEYISLEPYRFVCVDAQGGRLYLVPADTAAPLELLLEGEFRSAPRSSPDGVLAFQKGAHIWLMDLATRQARQFTVDGGVQCAPVWADDGKSLCYAHAPLPDAASWNIRRAALDAPGTTGRIARKVHHAFDWRGHGLEPGRTFELAGGQSAEAGNAWLRLEPGPGEGAYQLSANGLGRPIALRLGAGDGAPREAPSLSKNLPLVALPMDTPGRVGVELEIERVVVPDLLAGDFVCDPATLPMGATACLPSAPVALLCLKDEEALLLLAAKAGEAAFSIQAAGDGSGRATLWADVSAPGAAVAVLHGKGLWQRPPIEGDGKRSVSWRRPFHALWRMTAWNAEGAASHCWTPEGLGGLGRGSIPVYWRAAAGRFGEGFSGPPTDAVVYAWGRHMLTPSGEIMPTDVLLDLWGVARYLEAFDIEGLCGYRTGEPATPFRNLMTRSLAWIPAEAGRGSEDFGVLEALGSVFPVGSPGVRELVTHLGGDAIAILRGLDRRIGEYRGLAEDIQRLCGGLDSAAAAPLAALAEAGPEAPSLRMDLGRVEESLDKVLGVLGTRDKLTMPIFEAFCKMPGNEEWKETFEDFFSYLAAREGRLWYNDTIRFELWYDDNFRGFHGRCARALRERKEAIAMYRDWAKQIYHTAARAGLEEGSADSAAALRKRIRETLRNRYFLEGDWCGETPLPDGRLP